MRVSIKVKMTLLVAALLVAMMGLMLVANFFLAEPLMIGRQKQKIHGLYRTMSRNYSDDSKDLAALMQDYEDVNALQVEIFSQNGSLIYTSGRRMDEGFAGFGEFGEFEGFEGFPGGFPVIRPDRLEPQKYSTRPSVQRSEGNGRDLLSLHGILSLEDGSVRYISIESPVEAISETVQVLNFLTLAISILVAVGGCFGAWLYASEFSKPIIAISRNAKQVAALDFSHSAKEDSSTAEIADLAGSINTMSKQLETFIYQLMEKNRQLAEDNLRLAREEEMRRSFVANVSHDLKSPLAVLGGYAEMLKEHTEGIEPEACYDVIIEETAVMNEMIRSMLEVSALENGLRELRTEELNFSELLEELCGREQPLMEKVGLDFSFCAEAGILLQADHDLLIRAVMNILENAKAHCREGGRVEVSLFQEADTAVLNVYNDGERISADKLEKIWESFYKTNEARTRDEKNNVGLGLYIVKTITAAHGGDCKAINEEAGVRFCIRFPVSGRG